MVYRKTIKKYNVIIAICAVMIAAGFIFIVKSWYLYLNVIVMSLMFLVGVIMVELINKRHDLMYNNDDTSYMDDWD